MDAGPKPTKLLERTRAEERALVARFPLQERWRISEVGCWSAKDVIARRAGWNLHMAGQLAALGRGGGRADGDEIDAENA